ncbi:MAG: aminotransferase class III-fold pyridoxal phosphate-dependent enzyme, partial [Nocardioidaceae bacterium]|nr:aminotransferase class III-fold pyridoxal phosphate-dependent enzyme [Nocardioidaceae bacterium]
MTHTRRRRPCSRRRAERSSPRCCCTVDPAVRRQTGQIVGALWHGFSDMGAVEHDGRFVISRGTGAHVWDADGTRYLDATAGLWFTNVGHGRTEIAQAVAAQLGSIAAYSNFG